MSTPCIQCQEVDTEEPVRMTVWQFQPQPLEHTHPFLGLWYLGKLPFLLLSLRGNKSHLYPRPKVGPCLNCFQLEVITQLTLCSVIMVNFSLCYLLCLSNSSSLGKQGSLTVYC